MKIENYERTELIITEFEEEDVIITSGNVDPVVVTDPLSRYEGKMIGG